MADAFGAPPPRRVPAWLMRLVAPYVAFFAIDTSMRVANTKAQRELAGQTAVVPGAVEPFVGEGGDGAQLGEQRRPAQHPVGVVGVQPHALPLQVGQRSVVGRSCRSPASASAWAHPVA